MILKIYIYYKHILQAGAESSSQLQKELELVRRQLAECRTSQKTCFESEKYMRQEMGNFALEVSRINSENIQRGRDLTDCRQQLDQMKKQTDDRSSSRDQSTGINNNNMSQYRRQYFNETFFRSSKVVGQCQYEKHIHRLSVSLEMDFVT